jgi:hypothetical protein
LEPAFERVANSVKILPAFAALQVEWDNELEQNINVYVNLSYKLNGTSMSIRRAISSRKIFDRQSLDGLNLPETEPITVSFSVGDAYGNESQTKDIGQMYVMRDEFISKKGWVLPEPGTPIGKDKETGAPVYQSNGTNYEGRMEKIMDGVIENDGVNLTINMVNYNAAYWATVDGVRINVNQNPLWNLIIDLGDYYELSRIVTHQRWSYQAIQYMRFDEVGVLYGNWNVGIYEVFYLNETTNEWELINQTKIPLPPASYSALEIVFANARGDEAFMYPSDPKFTPKTRYFRYRPIAGFINNYAPGVLDAANALSELTLYGKKAN